MNCHIIPRVLTRDWEFKKGKVKYFSFNKNTFSEADTKSLFAKQNLLTQSEENFYNKYIETPLSHVIEKSTKDNNDTILLKKRDHMRACWLLLYSIIERSSNSEKKLPNFDIQKIDESISYKYHEENERVVLLNAHLSETICSLLVFNELGYFPIHYFSQTKNTYLTILGIPINKYRVLTTMEKESAQELIKYIKSKGNIIISNSSVGVVGDKVLIPPEVIKYYKNNIEELKKKFN